MAIRQWVSAAALVAVVVSANADALGGRDAPKRSFLDPMRMAQLAERLELTTEQRDQIDRLAANARRASRSHLDGLLEVRRVLREHVREGAFDENEVRQLAKQKALHEEELLVIRMRTQAAFRDLLTEAQQAALPQRGPRRRR